MKEMQKLFEYNVWSQNNDGTINYDDFQKRYVIAHDEDEADAKMDLYNEELKANGFLAFHYVNVGVHIDYVIV